MINQVYRLVAPFQFKNYIEEIEIEDNQILVRPKYLSICAADQRYYRGLRDQEVLERKLPMALIHEAVGTVVYDPKGLVEPGTNVVLLPNIKTKSALKYKENYDPSSLFRSSTIDGFMQSLVVSNRKDVIELHSGIDLLSATMLELLSVVFNAVNEFQKINDSDMNGTTIGIWGNGNLGYLTTLVLKHVYPESEIIIFGRGKEKMDYFTHVDEKHFISNVEKSVGIDYAFECVGGNGTKDAINQIIDHINPEGLIMMLGVSENLVGINTRDVLEKGLKMIGCSRSGHSDFEDAVEFLSDSKLNQEKVRRIISDVISINNIDDMNYAFNHDNNNLFKTVMKWEI